MTHICVSNLTIIGSDNGLSPGRRQAIVWTNAGILLIGPLATNFNEILIEIHTFSFKKMHSKISSGKWRLFCLGLNVLNITRWLSGISVNQCSTCNCNQEIWYSCPWTSTIFHSPLIPKLDPPRQVCRTTRWFSEDYQLKVGCANLLSNHVPQDHRIVKEHILLRANTTRYRVMRSEGMDKD